VGALPATAPDKPALPPLEQFNKLVAQEKPLRISGTAVYMARTEQGVPHALIHNLRHNHVLHERNLLMTFRTQDTPYVDATNILNSSHLALTCRG